MLVASVTHEDGAMVIRDVSWLWRTAYNAAIEGCSSWENQGEQVSEAFDAAREASVFFMALLSHPTGNSYWSSTSPRLSWTWSPRLMCTLRTHPLLQRRAEVQCPRLVLFRWLIRYQVLLAREKMSQDNVATVGFFCQYV